MGKNANKARVYDLEQNKEQTPKKSFHLKDLCNFQPKSDNQFTFIESYLNTDIETFGLFGYPGTGKSFLSIRCAMDDVLCPDTEFEQVIIFRSAVELRTGGFLPGTDDDKAAPFASPYYDLMDKVFDNKFKKTYQNLVEINKLKFETTSNQRGKTYDNAIFIVDECQNMNYEELRTIYTRSGKNCRVVFCGDLGQNDLIRKANDKSGLAKWIDLLNDMDDTSIIEFYSLDDIVRSGRIRNMIESEIKLGFV